MELIAITIPESELNESTLIPEVNAQGDILNNGPGAKVHSSFMPVVGDVIKINSISFKVYKIDISKQPRPFMYVEEVAE